MNEQAWWFLARASGLVVFVLVVVSTVVGLTISGQTFRGRVTAKSLTDTHESLSLATIGATLVHMGALVADGYEHFGLADLVVPGVSPWRRTGTALGVIAFWLLVVVSLSFYVRKRIGLRVWRALHYLSFVVFVLSLVHGWLDGRDTPNPLVQSMYGTALWLVAYLVSLRLLPDRRRTERSQRAAIRAATFRVKETGVPEQFPDLLPAPDPFVHSGRLR